MNLFTMVRLRQHKNGFWYIHYTRTKRNTLETKDKAEALRLFRRLRQAYMERKVEILTGQLPGKTLVDFWEEYEEHRFRTARPMTCQTDRQAFRVFRKALGDDTPLTKITRRQVEQARDALTKTVKSSSANVWFRHFRAALSLAKEWGYLRVNPCDGIKMLKTQGHFPRWLTEEEFARLLSHEPDPLYRLFWQFQVYGGARRRESLAVTVKDIKWERNCIDLGQTKNGNPRAIVLNQPLRGVLAALNREVGRLWPWQPDSVSHHFAHTSKKAGLACRLHDLRHTYGSWLVMKGVPLYTVGKLMGHQDTKTTQIYAHLSTAHMEEAAGRL